MNKLEITLQQEIQKISKWETVITNPEQVKLKNELDEIESIIPKSAKEYEEIVKRLKAIQTPLNKYNESFIKPIKRAVNFVKNEIIGGYENETVNKVKKLKKEKEQQAIDLELIFPVENETKEFIKKETKNKELLVRELIQKEIEKLSNLKKAQPLKETIAFLNKIDYELSK